MYDVGKDEVIQRYREMLDSHSDTLELREAFLLLADFVNEFGHIGHFILYNAHVYEQMYNMIKDFISSGNSNEALIRMKDIFTRDITVKTY